MWRLIICWKRFFAESAPWTRQCVGHVDKKTSRYEVYVVSFTRCEQSVPVFWCVNLRSDFFQRNIWCFGDKSDVDWVVFVLHIYSPIKMKIN